jgi:hypothetical protein
MLKFPVIVPPFLKRSRSLKYPGAKCIATTQAERFNVYSRGLLAV